MSTDKMTARESRRVGLVLSLWLIATAVSVLGVPAPARAQLLPGDSLVVDVNAGTGRRGALFCMSPATGTRLLLSDFGDAAQGPLGVTPFGVAVEAAGTILVADQNAGTNGQGALFRVNPSTGARTLLSDFGSGANQGVDPRGGQAAGGLCPHGPRRASIFGGPGGVSDGDRRGAGPPAAHCCHSQ
jgi:hypothetical protein